MLLCRGVLEQLWLISLGKEERNSVDMTTVSAFGQGSLSWQVCMAESIKSELFMGEHCVTVTVPLLVWEQAEILTLHKSTSHVIQLQRVGERLAVSCTCRRGRGLGHFKASEENKNNEDCKRILNSYWFWNEVAQKQGNISWIDRKATIMSLRRTDPGGTQRGFGLSSLLGIAFSQQHDFGLEWACEHLWIWRY